MIKRIMSRALRAIFRLDAQILKAVRTNAFIERSHIIDDVRRGNMLLYSEFEIDYTIDRMIRDKKLISAYGGTCFFDPKSKKWAEFKGNGNYTGIDNMYPMHEDD